MNIKKKVQSTTYTELQVYSWIEAIES